MYRELLSCWKPPPTLDCGRSPRTQIEQNESREARQASAARAPAPAGAGADNRTRSTIESVHSVMKVLTVKGRDRCKSAQHRPSHFTIAIEIRNWIYLSHGHFLPALDINNNKK